MLHQLRRRRNLAGLTARDVATATGIIEKDVCQVLKSLGMLRIWKGEQMVSTNLKAVEDAYKKLPPGKETVSDYNRKASNVHP